MCNISLYNVVLLHYIHVCQADVKSYNRINLFFKIISSFYSTQNMKPVKCFYITSIELMMLIVHTLGQCFFSCKLSPLGNCEKGLQSDDKTGH